ncbi:hypothetical protein [Streptomyces sp. NPDC058653]|uniref:hypothetical protein n=1 Tax=Streptomyces sp. NPDC058653 TaxID=3346576 RepID=UPI00365318ED
MDQSRKTDTGTGGSAAPGRLELSLPQVAGSALAAVAAAVLASRLGVYGTIIGAGVVSVVATSGGPVFQHLFRRTGDQLREVSVQVRPKARQVYDTGPPPTAPDPPGADRSRREPPAQGEFGSATTYGTRVRGWRRSVVAAGVVFAVAMVAVTGYELAAGQDLSGGKGTTFSSVVRGGDTGRDSSPGGPAGPKDGGTSPSDGSPGTGTDPGTGPSDTPATPSAPGDGRSPEPSNPPETGGPSAPPSPDTSRPDGGSGGPGGPGDGTVPPPPATAPAPTPSG